MYIRYGSIYGSGNPESYGRVTWTHTVHRCRALLPSVLREAAGPARSRPRRRLSAQRATALASEFAAAERLTTSPCLSVSGASKQRRHSGDPCGGGQDRNSQARPRSSEGHLFKGARKHRNVAHRGSAKRKTGR